MTQRSRFATILAAFAGAAFAQTEPAARPAYEAVVIKPNTSGSRGHSSDGSKSQIIMTNMPLRLLVQRALMVRPNQLIGPDWMDTTCFDISAKYPIDTDRPNQLRMLRTLLEDRFGLVTHPETRETEGYILVTTKSGIKAKATESGSGTHSDGNGKVVNFRADGVPMHDVAEYLGQRLDATVLDRTGLAGFFSFEMRYSPQRDDPKLADLDLAPSLFDELQSKAGLKLQAAKVPVQVYVVDKLNRTPADN